MVIWIEYCDTGVELSENLKIAFCNKKGRRTRSRKRTWTRTQTRIRTRLLRDVARN